MIDPLHQPAPGGHVSTAVGGNPDAAAPAERMVFLTMSSEIHIKSPRTRSRFIRLLGENLRAGLRQLGADVRLDTQWDRIYLEDIAPPDLENVARLASRTFGIKRAEIVRRIPTDSLEQLVEHAATLARPQVEGKTYAVRVRRRGKQAWRSIDAERLIGHELEPYGAGVNLTSPQAEVRIHAQEDHAYIVEHTYEGPDGLPMGTGGRALALLSGGFDSAVAAWMLTRRGLRVDYVHFLLDCSQSEHALSVTHELCKGWGHGRRSLMHVIDFQPIKDALMRDVPSRVRQVVLKQLMMAVADRLVRSESYHALITGDSLGQVSSQTIEHLAAIDRFTSSTVLRPLAGMTKQEIIEWARVIGTHDLSARAQEVCDLSDGPVAVAAKSRELERAHEALEPGLVEQALATCRMVVVENWVPGVPLIPMVFEPPPGVPLVRLHDGTPVPDAGPVALSGRRAPFIATRLQEQGREVWVVMARANDEAR